MVTFASSNFAKRAIAISLAKEFGPEGVHVAWANIDGPIGELLPVTKSLRRAYNLFYDTADSV